MKEFKTPTPLQLFKQWKKTKLIEDKLHEEEQTLKKMAWNNRDKGTQRLTVDGGIYELYISGYGNYYNARLHVTKLGSVEEFANLIK